MNTEYFELLARCLKEELRDWQENNYLMGRLAGIVILGLSEKMTNELKKVDIDFDFNKFMKQCQ